MNAQVSFGAGATSLGLRTHEQQEAKRDQSQLDHCLPPWTQCPLSMLEDFFANCTLHIGQLLIYPTKLFSFWAFSFNSSLSFLWTKLLFRNLDHHQNKLLWSCCGQEQSWVLLALFTLHQVLFTYLERGDFLQRSCRKARTLSQNWNLKVGFEVNERCNWAYCWARKTRLKIVLLNTTAIYMSTASPQCEKDYFLHLQKFCCELKWLDHCCPLSWTSPHFCCLSSHLQEALVPLPFSPDPCSVSEDSGECSSICLWQAPFLSSWGLHITTSFYSYVSSLSAGAWDKVVNWAVACSANNLFLGTTLTFRPAKVRTFWVLGPSRWESFQQMDHSSLVASVQHTCYLGDCSGCILGLLALLLGNVCFSGPFPEEMEYKFWKKEWYPPLSHPFSTTVLDKFETGLLLLLVEWRRCPQPPWRQTLI